ncbi:cytidine deaminase [Thaumasiovibrio sp. DFM-14]|uniref:cytidine deaminase n=1 Tax=Thaumasiovibrio sp. DFM-14 TaxID=3384792 RepID=UPI0039A1D3DE
MNPSFTAALSQQSEAIQAFFANEFKTCPFHGYLSKHQWQELSKTAQLDSKDLKLALLPLAASYSVAPISEFNVGAIVEALSGNIYFGANMEFHGIGMANTIHAEQSAISHAWSHGEDGISDITINYSPCGHCRQFMNELNNAHDLVIHLPNRTPHKLHEFLPDDFGPKDLGISIGLMAKTTPSFKIERLAPLAEAASQAAALSHAPYSSNLAGIALETKSKLIFSGMYAENAAFNPSLPPLQVALVQLILSGETFDNITSACLVESKAGKVSFLGDCQQVLENINPDIPLEYLTI